MKNPIVTIKMENGKVMKGELYPEIAPNTVKNFINLVEKGYYNGLIFHRVIPGFMIQGGCPEKTGMGGPGYAIKGEFTSNGLKNDLKHTEGVMSMARTMDPNSAGSQFFIMTSNSPHLDGSYAAFGKIIEGMEVAKEVVMAKRDMSDRPYEDQVMKEVTVETFGEEFGEPEKIS
ncbi:peptidylprolyl isomerase [Hathewaya histolytica]|uniref:peptidylprolyl isomerase n=1 Tax=Hathewaya histolytica TaxID=1498 RepID=UPI003B67BC49